MKVPHQKRKRLTDNDDEGGPKGKKKSLGIVCVSKSEDDAGTKLGFSDSVIDLTNDDD